MLAVLSIVQKKLAMKIGNDLATCTEPMHHEVDTLIDKRNSSAGIFRRGTFSNTVESLYCGHIGDPMKCPVCSGTPLLWTRWGPDEVSCMYRKGSSFLISGVNLYEDRHIWDIATCP